MKHLTGLLFCLVLGAPSTGLAREALSDMPALAAPGAYPVGVLTQTLIEKNQPDLVASALSSGKPVLADRALPLTVWYPAIRPAAGAPTVRYTMPDAPAAAKPPAWTSYKAGTAYPDAKPAPGKAFPLVVISHGYRNWATSFSDLAENLASKGYVVVSIDHHDLEPVTLKTPQLSFATTVATRVSDQRFVIETLTKTAGQGPLRGVYDPGNIALIGYSMGGFGALATMGAGLDPDGQLAKMVPPGLIEGFTDKDPGFAAGLPKGVKAMVAFAPWGGAPPLRAWNTEGLARITVPSLLIVGDHDDVSGYADGVAWLYDSMRSADRTLLVYENARHNIARDGTPPSLVGDVSSVERFEEPVWRRDRILAINRHFITAFLDARLKGDTASGAYLAAPATKDADWPGFPRRWSLGLQLRHDAPAAKPN